MDIQAMNQPQPQMQQQQQPPLQPQVPLYTQPPLLSCHGLFKTYGNGYPALDRIDLTLMPGHIVGLLGPNGSGKTTLIKLLAGLLTPTEGMIRIKGMEVGPETKKIISYLPDQTYLSDSMTVEAVIRYFQDFYADFDVQRAYHMLQMLAIAPTDQLRSMSKGTKEKVQLILVMSRRAELYLLDEPIAGVDPAARDFILSTIVSNFDPRATILISTHLINDIEPVLDEAIFLSRGHILLYQPVKVIREQEGKTVDELFREVFRYV